MQRQLKRHESKFLDFQLRRKPVDLASTRFTLAAMRFSCRQYVYVYSYSQRSGLTFKLYLFLLQFSGWNKIIITAHVVPVAVVYSYNTYFLYTSIFKFFGTTCPRCSRSCPFILYAPALLGVWHFLASTANISANFAKYRHLKKIYGFSPFSCKRTIFICFLATFFVNIFRFVLFFLVILFCVPLERCEC